MRPLVPYVALLAGIHATSLVTPAWGQKAAAVTVAPGVPPGSDAVHLRNGGMLRGTITEITPGVRISMALTTGQTATIEWSEIDRVERGVPPVQVAPPGTPTVAASGALAVPVAPRTVFVHVASDRPVRLEQQGEGRKEWALVCASPCDGLVPMDGKYQVAGDGVRDSGDFVLTATPGNRIVIEVDTGSKAGFVGGIIIVSAAPVVALVGLVFLAVGSVPDLRSSKSSSSSNVGIGLTFGGIAGTAAGIILIVTNARTKATQTNELVRAARWEPEWRDATREALVPAASPQLMFPAISF